MTHQDGEALMRLEAARQESGAAGEPSKDGGVLRVAKAIYAAELDPFINNLVWDYLSEDARAKRIKIARAAIRALREDDQCPLCGGHGQVSP